MQILIKQGRLLDPISSTDKVTDILIEDGYVTKIGDKLTLPAPKKRDRARSASGSGNNGDEIIHDESRIINASGCFVMPGLVDLHVHLRDPGLTYKEDIGTGADLPRSAPCRIQNRSSIHRTS